MTAISTKNIKAKKQLTEIQRRSRAGKLFILPFIIGFVCFYLQPLALSIYYTFLNMQPAKGGGVSLDWVGLENYNHMFGKETEFWQVLVKTLTEMGKNTPIIIIFSLFISIILNQNFRGRFLARAIFFMPVVVTSGIVISIIKGDAFYSNVESEASTTMFQAAGMADVLKGMNLPEGIIEWFTGVVGEIFDTLWKCGVQILLFLASLQSVPPQLYEAAKIEGATGWEIFWKVTFPNVSPIILVNLIYTIIDSITDANNELMRHINSTAFNQLIYSRACLEAWIFFIILLVIVGAVFLIGNRVVFYQTNK